MKRGTTTPKAKVISFQASTEILERLDEEQRRMRETFPGARCSQSDVLRVVLERGLASAR